MFPGLNSAEDASSGFTAGALCNRNAASLCDEPKNVSNSTIRNTPPTCHQTLKLFNRAVRRMPKMLIRTCGIVISTMTNTWKYQFVSEPNTGTLRVRRNPKNARDGADEVNRRGDVYSGSDGDLADHVEPRGDPGPAAATESVRPIIQPASGGVRRSKFGHARGDAQGEQAHNRPADGIDNWPGKFEPITVEQDCARQHRDDREGDREIGETAHLAEQLLSIAELAKVFHILLDDFFARFAGHRGEKVLSRPAVPCQCRSRATFGQWCGRSVRAS